VVTGLVVAVDSERVCHSTSEPAERVARLWGAADPRSTEAKTVAGRHALVAVRRLPGNGRCALPEPVADRGALLA
jgi:hypothetical protein